MEKRDLMEVFSCFSMAQLEKSVQLDIHQSSYATGNFRLNFGELNPDLMVLKRDCLYSSIVLISWVDIREIQ